MSLIEISVGLGMAFILGSSVVVQSTQTIASLTQQKRITTFVEEVSIARTLLNKTVPLAISTRVYDTLENAEAGGASGVLQVGGNAVRMEMSGGVGAGGAANAVAVLWFDAGTSTLRYRNVGGNEWSVVERSLNNATFEFREGILVTTLTINGQGSEIWMAAN